MDNEKLPTDSPDESTPSDRQVYTIETLPAEILDVIKNTKMNPKHNHLNSLVENIDSIRLNPSCPPAYKMSDGSYCNRLKQGAEGAQWV